MPLQTPDFWYGERPTALARALWPVSAIWETGHKIVQRRVCVRADLPVVCVGGLVAGGSGKTPVALAVRDLLGHGTFVTRGYGGRLAGPVLVDPHVHTYADVGDEALLLARQGPTLVARNRAAGAAVAQEGPIILDDGLHHPGLHKDLSLCVIDGSVGFGNGLTLPAGPLRERLETALLRCQAFILVGGDARGLRPLLLRYGPVFEAHMILDDIPKGPVVAFCGLGRPRKFRDSLHAAGAQVLDFVPFADHHPYTPRDIERLRTRARALGAHLITTHKDAMRLPFACPDIQIATAQMQFLEPDVLKKFLTQRLNNATLK